MGKYVISYRDFGTPGEISTVTVPIIDITDANIVAKTTQCDALRTAIGGVCMGGLVKRSLVAWENDTKTDPSGSFAQRETKWLVRFHEDIANGETHYMELPCANLSLLDAMANDTIDYNSDEYLAFKGAFEALVEVNGNDVVIDSMTYVARKT